MERKKVLITGCGRSGTQFARLHMRAQGHNLYHEGQRPHGDEAPADGNSCWYCCMLLEPNKAHHDGVTRCACVFPGITITGQGEPHIAQSAAPLGPHYELILHQLRSPLNVIGSLQTLTNGSWDFIDNKIGVYHLQDPILRATRYWIEWNRHAQQIASYSYRLEDLATQLPLICDMIGLGYDGEKAHRVLAKGATNSRRHQTVHADDIRKRDAGLYTELNETAATFGYQLC